MISLLNRKNHQNVITDVEFKRNIIYVQAIFSLAMAILIMIIYIVQIGILLPILVQAVYIAYLYTLYRALKNERFSYVKVALVIVNIVQLTFPVFIWFPVSAGFNIYYLLVPLTVFLATSYHNDFERYFALGVSGISCVLYFISEVFPFNSYIYQTSVGEERMFGMIIILSVLLPSMYVFYRYTLDIHEMHRRLELIIRTDSLTGVLNRRALFEQGEKAYEDSLQEGEEFAFIILDIDFFKKVNDTYGHPVGDQLIIEMTELIKKRLPGDGVLARYGGEEFGIVLPGMSMDEGCKYAETIRHAVENHEFYIQSEVIRSTISLGVVVNEVKHKNFAGMVQYADKYLYIAKENGRNRWVNGQVEK